MTDPIVLIGRTFSLGHVLISSVPGGANTIAYGNRLAIAADSVRRHATASKLRRLLRRDIASRYRTPALGVGGVPKHPLWEFTGRLLTRDGHTLFPIGSDAIVMVELF